MDTGFIWQIIFRVDTDTTIFFEEDRTVAMTTPRFQEELTYFHMALAAQGVHSVYHNDGLWEYELVHTFSVYGKSLVSFSVDRFYNPHVTAWRTCVCHGHGAYVFGLLLCLCA